MPFTSDATVLRTRSAQDDPARGRTALYDAIAAGHEYLMRGRYERKALVVVSDGGDNASDTTFEEILNRIAGVERRDSRASASSIPIERDANPKRLKQLAEASGGVRSGRATPAQVAERHRARGARHTQRVHHRLRSAERASAVFVASASSCARPTDAASSCERAPVTWPARSERRPIMANEMNRRRLTLLERLLVVGGVACLAWCAFVARAGVAIPVASLRDVNVNRLVRACQRNASGSGGAPRAGDGSGACPIGDPDRANRGAAAASVGGRRQRRRRWNAERGHWPSAGYAASVGGRATARSPAIATRSSGRSATFAWTTTCGWRRRTATSPTR